MKRFLTATMVLCCIIQYSSKAQTTSGADTLRKDALNVYFDEATSYLKERIPYINYVRDRQVADLIIIISSERNGAGGNKYTLFLEGQLKFKGMIDTLYYSSSPDETFEQIRDKQVKTLQMGLTRYVQKTPLAKYMEIKFSEPISSEVSTDRWNSWVFKGSLSGYLSGQATYKTTYLSGSVSVNRVTENWKMSFNSRYSSSKDIFEIDEDIYESNSISKSASALIVKSLGDHWSIGGTGSLSSSTYSNYDLKLTLMPGIEYDVFPYSESTRRQFRFLYTAGYVLNNYTDTTIYNVTSEDLFSHSLSASFEVIQKWGSIEISANWSNYLRDFSKNSLSLDGYISWRVAKGLSINMGGYYSFIHDQISLVKGGASTEDILLRRKEMETNFNYFVHFGFSYTFGSIYNNVVNPRFGNSGGNMIIIN